MLLKIMLSKKGVDLRAKKKKWLQDCRLYHVVCYGAFHFSNELKLLSSLNHQRVDTNKS